MKIFDVASQTQEIASANPKLIVEKEWLTEFDVPVEAIDVLGLEEPIQKYEQLYLVPLFSKITAAELRSMIPNISKSIIIIGLDFPVSEHEKGTEVRSKDGTLIGVMHDSSNVLNIDHHIPLTEMARPISTTPLVTTYVHEHGSMADKDCVIIINHVDADSLLSVLVLTGQVDASDQRFNQAAIDADHTGRKNNIGDLLVALEPKRDLKFSLFCLNKFLRNETLPEEAQLLLKQRLSQRDEAQQLVNDGKLQYMGKGVYLIISENTLRSELFPPAKEDATIFVVATPKAGGWEYKVRAGNAFPTNKRLNEMDIPYFGGRWNAGGTKRQGVVPIDPQTYAQLIADKL
ncbi:hypothetical protein KA111_00330 [Candidatus Woesebacteria bacterium]|nr:hypothetical protein [Candidatus Woesebacteria bacterium]